MTYGSRSRARIDTRVRHPELALGEPSAHGARRTEAAHQLCRAQSLINDETAKLDAAHGARSAGWAAGHTSGSQRFGNPLRAHAQFDGDLAFGAAFGVEGGRNGRFGRGLPCPADERPRAGRC
ncbi:MAG: hypothetical protein ACLGHT_02875 [Acidimicrobiia bacterium]